MKFANKFILLNLSLLTCFMLTIHGDATPLLRSTYIVHIKKSSMLTAFMSHQSWYISITDFLNFTNSISMKQHQWSSPSLLYTYDFSLYGFSAFLSFNKLNALKNFPGFILATKDKSGKIHIYHLHSRISFTQPYIRYVALLKLWPRYHNWYYW